ncbi:hypothetical protein HGP17_01745 [Rhizobium sp. P38BS-XIX]|uniref:hypothetical protein n=1 Tax=Rhizobium sp. P38BS-XIX TaxID=2726740 RepID=UPI0014575BD4|nr:hypothetical protein [Rhizobium sp. P38BS-XIX]NLR95556.1 hypothetical protein [Rhizobium sp. P38BS-XIX]
MRTAKYPAKMPHEQLAYVIRVSVVALQSGDKGFFKRQKLGPVDEWNNVDSVAVIALVCEKQSIAWLTMTSDRRKPFDTPKVRRDGK